MAGYKVLYKPKGKAAEYCNGYAANLYRGCGHKCVYCYAPRVLRMNNSEFFNHPQPRKNILENLRHDLDIMVDENDIQEVFLSFTSDPFQPCESEQGITLRAIMMLEDRNIPYRILTKGCIPYLANLRRDLCTVGSTLVFELDVHSRKYEPNAPITDDRISMLWRAHTLGFKTWVSLEPVWTPNDAFSLIKLTHEFVDKFYIGKLNYHPHAKEVQWLRFAREVSELCDNLGVDYVLKEDLRKLLEVNQ